MESIKIRITENSRKFYRKSLNKFCMRHKIIKIIYNKSLTVKISSSAIKIALHKIKYI